MRGTMPPPAKKKRKTAAGSVPVGTRTTRSQRPCLSLEMIAKVATFANYDGSDLMNVCLAVGPTDAAVVRYTCLRKNYCYLRHILEQNVHAEDEEEGASAASYAVDASPPLTRRWPRRTSRRRRTTSPASLDRGTRTTQTRTRPEHRSAAAR